MLEPWLVWYHFLFFPTFGLSKKEKSMSRGWARYHLLVYASYTWKFSFKKNCNCNWFMLHIQNLKRLIDTEWDCYLMVSTLSFLNFDLYQYFVIYIYIYIYTRVCYIILCTHTFNNYLMHNIYIHPCGIHIL